MHMGSQLRAMYINVKHANRATYDSIILNKIPTSLHAYTFHISHMISKSRRSSIKEVVHPISFIIRRAIWDMKKIMPNVRKSS